MSAPVPLFGSMRLWFDHTTVDTSGARVKRMRDAQLMLLDPAPDTHFTNPSELAYDMVVRLTKCADGQVGPGIDSPQYEEAAAMLGCYVRRLEDIARQYAAHIRTNHCTPI